MKSMAIAALVFGAVAAGPGVAQAKVCADRTVGTCPKRSTAEAPSDPGRVAQIVTRGPMPGTVAADEDIRIPRRMTWGIR